MNQEERKKLAEKIRNLKPGESVTVILENQKQAAELRKDVAQQPQR